MFVINCVDYESGEEFNIVVESEEELNKYRKIYKCIWIDEEGNSYSD